MLIESIGVNPEASRQAGVRARELLFAVYVFCAVCAAIAGLILTSNQTAADANNTGLFIELDAILAVVIGGTSLAGGRYSLLGTLVGALVIQTLVTTVYTVGIPPIATMVFKAAVVAAVCLLQSPATGRARPTMACCGTSRRPSVRWWRDGRLHRCPPHVPSPRGHRRRPAVASDQPQVRPGADHRRAAGGDFRRSVASATPGSPPRRWC